MSEDTTLIPFQVVVADQTFRVRIRPEERERFERIARFTKGAFEDVAGQAIASGAKAWAMTAFQIACELYDTQQQLREAADDAGASRETQERIERIIQRIEKVTSGV